MIGLVPPDTKLEAETRREIDVRLEAAGWAVQDKQRINLTEKPGVAVREMDTDTGPADYMLFVEGAACGIIEAKREGSELGHVDWQSQRYATSHSNYIERWAAEGDPPPFLYEATNVEIRFRDERDPTPRSRNLFHFHRPETLKAWLEEGETLRARLQRLPELNSENLRACQIDAIHGIEHSLKQGKPRALLQMGNGSGKTYTAVNEIYRLEKFAKVKREYRVSVTVDMIAISAILLKADHVYIRGYKPAWNYQALLEAVVMSRLEQVGKEIQTVEDALSMRLPEKPPMPDLHSLFVNPPETKIKHGIREQREFKTKHINYAEKEASNRALGRHGEEFVLAVEKARLASLGRSDLARDIEWTSKEKGDGAGYDIRSFEGKTDEELFIEVKTTNSGMYQPFLITRNELLFSEANVERYALYRLFDFADTPAVFSLKGRITDHVQLEPRVYSAGFYE